jgi:ribosomal protein L35AE/L33A
MGVSGKTTQRMNNNPELASLWKGRVLVHTTAEETEKPKLIARKIKAEQRAEAEKYIKNRVFSTKVYVSDVVNTPEKNKKYKVEVRIGDV